MKTYDYIVEAMSIAEVDEILDKAQKKLGMKESKRPRRGGRKLQEKFGEAPGWLSKFLAETKPGMVSRDEYKKSRDGKANFSAFNSLLSRDLRPSEIKVKSSGPFIDNPIPGACYLFDNGQVWCVGLNDDMKAQFDDKKRPFSWLPKKALHRHVKDSVLMDLPAMSSDASFRDNSVSKIQRDREEAREGSIERFTTRDRPTLKGRSRYDASGFVVKPLKDRLKKKYPEMFEDKKMKLLYEYIDKVSELKYIVAKKLSNSIINVETKGDTRRNRELDRYKNALEYLLRAVEYANEALSHIEEYGYTPGEGLDIFVEGYIDNLVSYVESVERELKEAGSVNESFEKPNHLVGVGDVVHIIYVPGYPQLTNKKGIVKEIDKDEDLIYGTWGKDPLAPSDDFEIIGIDGPEWDGIL